MIIYFAHIMKIYNYLMKP